MSYVREYAVIDPELGRRRAYTTTAVAAMANVTPKTVTTWVSDGGGAAPAPLRGWAPKSGVNQSGRWLIDADMADDAFGGVRTATTMLPASDPLAGERERLAEERAVFDLERRVFEESRIVQLENEVARLRAQNEKLSSQVSRLGGVIRDLTSDVDA